MICNLEVKEVVGRDGKMWVVIEEGDAGWLMMEASQDPGMYVIVL